MARATKRLKRGESGKSCIRQEVLTPTRSMIGLPVQIGDYLTVDYDSRAETVTVRILRERTTT